MQQASFLEIMRGAKISTVLRRGAAVVPLLALILLTGCEQSTPVTSTDEEELKDVRIKRMVIDTRVSPRKDLATGNSAQFLPDVHPNPTVLSGMVPNADVPVGSAYGGGHTDAQGRARGADSDYIDKADVYWKLNWLRKHLHDRMLPPEFERAITKAQTQLEDTVHDKNYQLGDDAIKHLKRGLEGFRDAELLRTANINVLLVPWSSDDVAVQRFVDGGGLGFGARSGAASGRTTRDAHTPLYRRLPAAPPEALSPTQEKILAVVKKYARDYRISPDTLRAHEWDAAAEKIDHLRDELGLMNRRENSDDSSRPAVPDLDTDMSGVNNLVPIPDVSDGGTAHGETGTKNPDK